MGLWDKWAIWTQLSVHPQRAGQSQCLGYFDCSYAPKPKPSTVGNRFGKNLSARGFEGHLWCFPMTFHPTVSRSEEGWQEPQEIFSFNNLVGVGHSRKNLALIGHVWHAWNWVQYYQNQSVSIPGSYSNNNNKNNNHFKKPVMRKVFCLW